MFIRKFRDGDAPILSQLIRRDLTEVNTEDPQWENDYLYAFYTPENIIKNSLIGHTYVIEDREELVGTGTIKPDKSNGNNEAEICACFIRPESLGCGFGRKLFEALEADELFVNADRTWLTTSIYASKFYEKIGYKYTYGYMARNADKLIEMDKCK